MIAYLRGEQVVTVVPRLTVLLGGQWQDTVVTLPDGTWRNELTGEQVAGGARRMQDVLRAFPVALLSREDGSNA